MRSAFFRQMVLITVLTLLTLSFLGGTFLLGMNNYLAQRQERALSGNAEAVADLARAYASVGDLTESWDFRMSVSLASRVSEADAVVCDPEGQIVACACEDFSCAHTETVISADFLAEIPAETGLFMTGTLSGLYEDSRYVQALRLTSYAGEELGVVIVSSPTADTGATLRGMFRVFFYTALLVWFLALLVALLVSRHEARPMRELTQTVRRFGHGDLSVRAKKHRSDTAEMTELVSAFNNMADSLEQADRMRTEFVANVSHELKTPMTSIAGYLDGMLDGTIPSEKHRQYMELVTDEVRRLSRLVRSMLEISRMQAEGLDESRVSRFDLGEAVTQTLLTFEQQIRARRLDVEMDLPEKPLYTVAHKDAITQVVYNLIDNAVKFSSDCGILSLRIRAEGAKAYVTVQNTGPVIPAAELPFIFNRFHKLDKSRSKDPGSVGLGLYIVKTIIGAHGEDIRVESHDGKTAFTFTLPLAK